jgi:histone acetyltransferase (RNA polymerase elongator complex component)
LEIKDIDSAVETALESADCNKGEIAFFGGSFTAIDKDYMISLLERAKMYIDKGLFAGIRVSTRPDCINEEILDILKKYGVTSIELGCQSMSDEVLKLNNRGHSSDHVIKSAEMIKRYGFEFGVQMMTGLYGDNNETAIETAKKLIALSPDTARIYPTVVLENTELERLYRSGGYKPQTVDEAADICSKLLMMFHEAHIRVIRVGLHSGGNVEEGFVAGAYHPAFREICESRIYLQKVLSEIKRQGTEKGDLTVTVGPSFVSMMSGQKKANTQILRELGYNLKIKQDSKLKKYEVEVGGKI